MEGTRDDRGVRPRTRASRCFLTSAFSPPPWLQMVAMGLETAGSAEIGLERRYEATTKWHPGMGGRVSDVGMKDDGPAFRTLHLNATICTEDGYDDNPSSIDQIASPGDIEGLRPCAGVNDFSRSADLRTWRRQDRHRHWRQPNATSKKCVQKCGNAANARVRFRGTSSARTVS